MASLREALADEEASHVFYTAWSRMNTEQENIETNAAMLRNLLASLSGHPVKHAALMTGLKHYPGPFEAYAAGEMPDAPFRESEPRLPTPHLTTYQRGVRSRPSGGSTWAPGDPALLGGWYGAFQP